MKIILVSRLQFIKQFIGLCTAALGAGFIMSSCRSGKKESVQSNEMEQNVLVDPCDDLSDLNRSEIEKREQLGYVKETPIPENRCDNCSLYILPSNDGCGGCELFEGPVRPDGYCPYWA